MEIFTLLRQPLKGDKIIFNFSVLLYLLDKLIEAFRTTGGLRILWFLLSVEKDLIVKISC